MKTEDKDISTRYKVKFNITKKTWSSVRDKSQVQLKADDDNVKVKYEVISTEERR